MSSNPADLLDGKNASYSVEFFDMQLRFAQRVAELSDRPFKETVGCFTNLYVRLAMGRRFDSGNADWQQYVGGLMGAGDQAAWTHSVHLQRLHLPSGPAPIWTEGCFSFELVDADRVRLHFHAVGAKAPLSPESCGERLKELARLFAHLKASSNDGIRVTGASWLYNLDRYRRLFPGRYLTSLRVVEHPYQRMPLWGQLLMRDRTVRSGAGPRFLAETARAESLHELARCFPLSVLATTAPAIWFYDHLGL